MAPPAVLPAGYEPSRLRRGGALVLDRRVTRIAQGEYRIVSTSGQIRYVNLNIDEPCGCEDRQFRGERVICKHIAAALLLEGDESLLIAWGRMLEKAESFAKENGQCPG